MSDESQAPILITPLPHQVINEGAGLYCNLNDFIESANFQSGVVRFFAELSDGNSLPDGLICTSDGILSGIPARGTAGEYEVLIVAENDSGIPLSIPLNLTIHERLSMEDSQQYFTQLKAKVWEALGQHLPLPDLTELLNRPITANDMYYLYQRMALLTIWDVYNLDLPGDCKPITLEGVSEHYQVYDRGSCLVGAPKDLFSYDRTLEDALQTSRAMAHEVFRRNWTVELSGFDKMARGCWVELQCLMEQHNKRIEIIHYDPTPHERKLFEERMAVAGIGRKM